eukprot:jgi/Undpi1/528/HiC_scaffold_10.g03992.m1
MAETLQPLLQDTASRRCFLENKGSFRCPRDNKLRFLRLTESVLEHTDSAGLPLLLHLADVIGAKARPAQAKHGCAEGEIHQLEVFAYIRGSKGCATSGACGSTTRNAAHQIWLASDAGIAAKWATAINDRLKVDRQSSDGSIEGARVVGPGRRLLVLINPASGQGRSRSAWDDTLQPMLEQAMSKITLIVSSRPGELANVVTEAGIISGGQGQGVGSDATDGGERGGEPRLGSLDDFDGIVTVGGDGTLHEVLQGIYARPDCAKQLSRLSLGVVPAGSGNGLAKTVSEESGESFGVMCASFLAARGRTKQLDLLPTECGDKKYLACLNVGWGMISDVDIESEAYRWIGSLRFTVGTVVRITNLRHYRGRITFLEELPSAEKPVAASTILTDEAPFSMPTLAESIDSTGSASEGWTSVEGDFVLACVAQAKYISHDMPMAPASRLGDGLMDLFFVKKGASRIAMIKGA